MSVGREPVSGWHMSISHRTNHHPPRPGRYPRWGEIKEARYRFTPWDVTMCMILPRPEAYVNLHETCFHLWEHRAPEEGNKMVDKHDDVEVQPLEVRGKDFPVWVDARSGHFYARFDGVQHWDATRDGLREKLMRATKTAAAKVEVKFMVLRGNDTPELGIATGIHQSNHNLLLSWPSRQGHAQRTQEGYMRNTMRVLSDEEQAEWVRLATAAKDAARALDAWQKDHEIDLKQAVRDQTEAAVAAMPS